MTLAPSGDAAPEADPQTGGPLEGELLVAMPSMGDPRFAQTVIFMCSHGDDGAMGLIVNKRARELSFADLLKQVGVKPGEGAGAFSVHFGGPVEMGRGLVLHSDDWEAPGATKPLARGLALTATVDILRDMSAGKGPRQAVLALGYAGWAPGQLEQELQANGWLICPSDPELVFGPDDEGKWRRAMLKIGVDPAKLSAQGGVA
ncbi:MAG: YqgE/AlgH family protein [Albimonas sp.]|uniref:YqgE/AlgH family protein n=1 Tax=Albimonas sp. TaxID=1872425 RepID=UPI004056E6C1